MTADTEPVPQSILMTADTVGGVWTYAVELAGALQPYGIHVTLAAMGGLPRPDQRAQVARLTNTRLFESEFKLEWMGQPWDDVRRAGEWLRNLEVRCSPDLIHLNDFAHGDLDWAAPVLMVGHSCVLSWWEAVHGAPAPAEWSAYASRVRQGLGGADMVVAPSRAMLASLNRHYGPLPSCAVIPNGRTAERYRKGVKEPFILAAGRLWDEAKNISALTRVAARVPWEIRVAGEQSASNGATGLTHLGRLGETELAAVMASAAIYALPARYEPFGLSILEAALSGCALVLGDIPSLRENWEGAAIFVHPDDSDQLRHALAGLAGDAERRERLASAAGMRAREFAPRRMASRYVEAYRSARVSQAEKGLQSCA